MYKNIQLTRDGRLATVTAREHALSGQALEAAHQGLELPLEDGLRLEANLFAVTFTTEDKVEGNNAFLEKRQPEWKNA